MNRKVAIIHDWFINPGGAEKVVHQLIDCYPDADLFSIIDTFNDKQRADYIFNKKVKTTFIQWFPLVRYYYRFLFPLFPLALLQHNLSKYDLIISSSHSFVKGVKRRKGQLHICYIHTPFRYAWDLRKQYLTQIPGRLLKYIFSKMMDGLKKWDLLTNDGIDYFVANSQYVAKRVNNNYQREAEVIYPPIETDYFTPDLTKQKTPEQPYFMVISRLIMYKRIDLIVKAFNQRPDLKLVIAGDGPKLDYLKKIANKNVVLLGYCSDAEVKDLMTNARATIFAAYEDFGISPVETQACGTPVIALRKGGYLETVIENETGLFFEHQTTNSLLEVIDEFLKMENNFSKETIIKQAQKFDTQVFTTKFMNFVDSKINQ